MNSERETAFPAAHLSIHGVRVLVVFLDAAFDSETADQRRELYTVLRNHAARTGLAGEVAIVWQDGSGTTRFLAPPQQHAFFQVMSYRQLYAQVDQTLTLPGS
jgi:hypothetical protein